MTRDTRLNPQSDGPTTRNKHYTNTTQPTLQTLPKGPGRGYGGRGLLARTGKGRGKGKGKDKGKGKVKGKGNKRPTPKKTRHLTTDRAIAVIRSHVREAKKLAKQHQLKVTFAKSADGYDDDDDSGYDDDYGDYGI